MSPRDKAYKWFFYALALVPVWLGQELIFSRLTLFGYTPVLFPLAAAAVAMLEGSLSGAVYGLCAGLLWHCVGSESTLILLFLTLVGILVGAAARSGTLNLLSHLLCCAGTLLALELCRIVPLVFSGRAPLRAVAPIAAAEFLLSLPFSIPVYLLYRAVYRKVGGDTLA